MVSSLLGLLIYWTLFHAKIYVNWAICIRQARLKYFPEYNLHIIHLFLGEIIFIIFLSGRRNIWIWWHTVADLEDGYWGLSPECFSQKPGSERRRRKRRCVNLTCSTRVYQSGSSCEQAVWVACISYIEEVPIPSHSTARGGYPWLMLCNRLKMCVCVCVCV